MAVFMMINSHRITRNKRLVPEAKKIMGRSAGAIWEKYYEVFNENSHKRRSVFFKDPAVQFLWFKFQEKKAQQIIECIDSMVAREQDNTKRNFIIIEIRTMEDATGC